MTLTKENYFFQDQSWWFTYNKHTTYNESNKLHSYNDKPALIFKDSKGKVCREEWYCNGIPHREGDKPAVVIWYTTLVNLPIINTLEWYHYGKLHRDKCAITSQQYPARLLHKQSGEVFIAEFYIDGRLHNSDDAAYKHYVSNSIIEHKHYLEGQLHNLYGPAIYEFVRRKVYDPQYYIFGSKYSYKEYIKQKFIFNTIINKVRSLRRKILAETLKTTVINTTNGPDICNLVSTYVY